MPSMFRNSKKVQTALKVMDIVKTKNNTNNAPTSKTKKVKSTKQSTVVTLSVMIQFLKDNDGDLDLLYKTYVGDLEYRKQMADEAYMLFKKNLNSI
ncbi:hypothetical protein GAP32_028 [Cronobacter phage vB_CsaM_GAP32]|uniref:Uncharacterized protein n=1 Tax=Cronobacter phage vB_CsaM_GAP32 TaxID=1141136 RepID=K4F5K5_9CAUD|nr:hypothetical protein GAP32_028 [Cronobacter phage vB_CsaM_GAP32]AFC21476.1 hypothetical protein GAP32_028 [Cronobacter phage vB_CsaM_GAP32]